MNMIQECELKVGMKFELDPEQTEEFRGIKLELSPEQTEELRKQLAEHFRKFFAAGPISSRATPWLPSQITSVSLSPVECPKDASLPEMLEKGRQFIRDEWTNSRR